MITFELENEDFPFNLNDNQEFTIQTDKGPKYYQIYRIDSTKARYSGWLTTPIFTNVITAYEINCLSVKSKEEKLAEEAVKAAQEALNKAKESLSAVRGKK